MSIEDIVRFKMSIFKKISVLLCIFLVGCNAYHNPPKTQESVDLAKYMGTWYEIASFPNSFQRGCKCTTATYALDNDQVKVLNRCYKGESNKLSQANGKAWSVSPDNSRLKVQFFWPFRGDYWILHITPGYQQVIVGSPNRHYLWILARTPQIDSSVYDGLLQVVKAKGYDIGKLVSTQQNCPL